MYRHFRALWLAMVWTAIAVHHAAAQTPPPQEHTTPPLIERQTQPELQLRAQLKAKDYALISAGISGIISSLDAREGQHVRQGERIATLDCSAQHAAHAVATAKLAGAKAKKSTNLRLQQLQSISDLEVQLSISEADIAAAELQAIETSLEKCIILAPFDGIITRQDVQAHQFVQEGAPLVELTSSENVEIEMILPSHWLVWLETGTDFTLRITETGQTIAAKVTSIGGKIDPISQTVRVLGEPVEQSKRLLPGMSGILHFDIPDS